MKKNVLILLSVLVMAMFIVGCGSEVDEDLPPGIEDEGALAGQAGYSSIPLEVGEEFNENGLLFDTKLNYIIFVDEVNGMDNAESFFSTIGFKTFFIYDTTNGKILIPENSQKYATYKNSGWIDSRKAAGKWLESVPLNHKLMIYMMDYPTTLEPTVEEEVTLTGDNYLCPECKVRETTSDYYIGGFTDNCCETVPGCHWEGSPTSQSNPGQCVSDIDGKVEGIATGCADYSEFTSGSSVANRARDLACADPCMFEEGAGANDICELGEGVTIKGISELSCDEESVIEHKETFMTPDGNYFEYKGADEYTFTDPKVKFKNFQTGETIERSVSIISGYGDWASQVGFNLKHEGITYNFVNASSADVDDFDIRYVCEVEEELAISDLTCDQTYSKDELFGDGDMELEYEDADKITDTTPQIKFKDLNTGETLERSLTLNQAVVNFHVNYGGKTYDFVNASSADDDDFDIRYVCEEEVQESILLSCNWSVVIKDDEWFVTPNGNNFQYKGADKASVSDPKVKFKNFQTGETIERSVSFSFGQATFNLKDEGITYNFVNESNANFDDFDIRYVCG